MERHELLAEYTELDKRIRLFREAWNKQAYKDIRDALRGKPTKPQGDYPEWVFPSIDRWKELKELLNIA